MSFDGLTAIAISLLLEASPSPSPQASDFATKMLGEYGLPQAFILPVKILIVLGTIGIVLKFIKEVFENSEKLHGYLQKLTHFFQGDPAQQSAEIRKKLLIRIRNEVDRRIATSLLNQIWMDVQLQDHPDAIESAQLREPRLTASPSSQQPNFLAQIGAQVGRLFKLGNQPEEKLESNQPLIEVFDRSNGRLLILGEPGSGKTTELLKLAKQLIEQAEEDEAKPIPVIFELSAWKDDQQTIEQWLVAQLKEVHNVPDAVSQHWLENNQLIPLLDGLDELAIRQVDEVDRRRQILCVEAINDFANDSKRKLAVCCRRQDYDQGFEQGRVKLDKLKGAIRLQPLNEAQIEKYFNDLNRPQIWEHIRQQPDLKPLVTSPLFLSMMVVACQGRTIANPTELFNAYIEEQFISKRLDLKKYPTRNSSYSRFQTGRYLSWLAKQLKAEAKTEFLIEKMQPTLLETAPQRWQYRLIFGLIVGLIGGLIGGLIVGLIVGLIGGLIFGLIGGLIVGLIFGLDEIELTEAFQISMSRAVRREIFKSLWEHLIFGLIVGLIGGLIVGLIGGLIFGLIGGLIGGLIVGLRADVQTRSKPNQGIWQSVWNIIPVTLLSLPAGVAIFALLSWLRGKPIDWIHLLPASLGCALVFGFFAGGVPCIQHVTLRFVLWNWGKGVIPWNYARFLDYAHDLRLIQRVGGRYRFIHDLLREHFAAMGEWGKDEG